MTQTTVKPGVRLEALDILRGLVIVIMALDHVRDYFHESLYAYDPLDPKFTTLLLYCTRWITHLCAPTFVFLAGVSIWLQAAKGKDKDVLSKFLVLRGFWLVLLEFTVISFAWSFSIPYLPFLQVFWAIGCSMMAMGALIWLPRVAVLGIGVGIIALHNLTDGIKNAGLLWAVLHQGVFYPAPEHPVAVAFYPLLPWLGVMAFGYGMGAFFLSAERDKVLRRVGGAMILLFFALRIMHGYGDPIGWAVEGDTVKTAMRFFNVQKYPPSLQYVCITLGPVLFALPWIAQLRGRAAGFFRTFGAVPLGAYIAHLFILHALSIAVHAAAGRSIAWEFDAIRRDFVYPDTLKGMGFDLWVVYVAWIVVVALVYRVSVFWGEVKRTRREWWVSYL